MSEEQFITHDFKLPSHDNELSKANDVIEKLKTKLNNHKKSKNIDDKEFVIFFEEVIRALDYVGRLSMPAFGIEDQLEDMYTIQYKHSPALAKQLWLEHYGKIHKPYNLLKNRCYKIMEELDALYRALYKKNPPNWEI